MNEPGRTKRSNTRWILYAVSFLAVVAIAVIGYWYLFNRNIVFSDDARIDAHMVDIAPRISGVLAEVSVREGDMVTTGQPLFTLDSTMLGANLEKAENDLATAREALAIAEMEYRKMLNGPREEEVRIAETAVRIAGDKLRLAEMEWNRADNLHQEHSVSESEWDQARTNYAIAQDAYDEAMDSLHLLEQGAREEDRRIAELNMALRKAQIVSDESMAQLARINLGYAEVTAPFDGIVVRRWRNPGAMTPQGTPVLTLLDTSTIYISANIVEKYLSRIEPQDAVDISIDAVPGLRLQGHVATILQAANSQFSLLPSEGVSGTYIKVSQRIPVNITLDNPEEIVSRRLGPGLSVEVRIHTDSQPARTP